MKRTLLLAVLAFGIGLVSCDKNDPGQKSSGELVDVEITSGSQDSKTRTLVTASGVTRWAKGDEVMIIDAEGTPRVFKYTDNNPQSKGNFKGQLLGGHGLQTYYAYYAPEHINCNVDNNHSMSMERQNLTYVESGESIAAFFGKHCPMVAVPVKFDVDNIGKVNIEFHHVNTLIEASISCDPETDDCPLRDVNFNKVVCFVDGTQNESAPFNTRVSVNLRNVKGKPDNEVEIPFMEVGDKEHTMSTTITYNSVKNLGDLMAASPIGCYSIPVFALPTTSDCKCEITVTFYKDAEEVCKLYMRKGFAGLNPAGLNILNFDVEHIVG